MRPFRSEREGLQRAILVWVCRACRARDERRGVEAGTRACPACGGREFWRLASKAEAQRFAELDLLHRAGKITRLECQPRIPLKVNGIKVGTYVADFVYADERGRLVYEDVKPAGFRTDLANLKMALARAIYSPAGFILNVVER